MKREVYRQAAQLHSLLSHPARLQILDELRRDEACVCHLQTALKRPQAYVSQQLRVLRLLEEVLGTEGEPSRPSNCPCPKCSPEASNA